MMRGRSRQYRIVSAGFDSLQKFHSVIAATGRKRHRRPRSTLVTSAKSARDRPWGAYICIVIRSPDYQHSDPKVLSLRGLICAMVEGGAASLERMP